MNFFSVCINVYNFKVGFTEFESNRKYFYNCRVIHKQNIKNITEQCIFAEKWQLTSSFMFY